MEKTNKNMRIIKFRAWDVDHMENNVCACYKNINEKEIILMQFTGLFDKNGKEIYEGDIVKCLPNGWDKDEFTITEVYYKNDSASFEGFVKTFRGDKLPEVEIIGNKFENKDLIK